MNNLQKVTDKAAVSTPASETVNVYFNEQTSTIEGIDENRNELNFNSASGSSAKRLVFNCEQVENNAPRFTATFENTLTDPPVLSRGVAGFYLITSTDFEIGKVHINGVGDWQGNGTPVLTLWDEGAIIGYLQIYANQTPNEIGFETFNAAFVRTEWSTVLGATKISFPAITVYP